MGEIILYAFLDDLVTFAVENHIHPSEMDFAEAFIQVGRNKRTKERLNDLDRDILHLLHGRATLQEILELAQERSLSGLLKYAAILIECVENEYTISVATRVGSAN